MNKTIVISMLLTLLLGIGGALVLTATKTTNACYINIGEFMNEFTMAKELNSEFEKVANARMNILDSLGLDIDRMAKNLDVKNKESERILQQKKEGFFLRKQQFDAQNNELKNKYNAQVIKRMNEYIRDFGKQKGYAFIYGAKGDGGLLYADESKDITKRLIEYANQRYAGKN